MAYFLNNITRSNKNEKMKKLGIVILSVGIILMGVAAYKFIKDKRRGSEEEVQKEPVPFPWLPTAGALLTATGIIMIGSGDKKTVI
jgi:hypothetical protein